METNFEITCNAFVSKEVDRLARLSPCELMQLTQKGVEVTVADKAAKLFHHIVDFGDTRRIGVILLFPSKLGFGGWQFRGGVRVHLRSERISGAEAAELFDFL